MEPHGYSLSALFNYLGLDGSHRGIEQFVVSSNPIPSHLHVWDSPIWSERQVARLKHIKSEDPKWTSALEQLDLLLRA